MTIQPWHTLFPTGRESVHCSLSNSNCCFLTYTQVSQEAGKVVWYFNLFCNFPQCVVIYTVKGFSVVNNAEVNVFFFWNYLAFPMIHWMLAIRSLVPLPFLNPAWTSGNTWFTYCWNLMDFEHYLATMWNECNCVVVWKFFGITLLWD